MRQKTGRLVLFGDTIQLFHVKSKKYLNIMPKKPAKDERENLSVTLSPDGNTYSWLNIVPRYKVDREGDVINNGVEFYLKVTLRHSEYIHCSDNKPRQGNTFLKIMPKKVTKI